MEKPIFFGNFTLILRVLVLGVWGCVMTTQGVGVQTQEVHHFAYTDFVHGDIHGLTLSQQGVLALGQEMREVAAIEDALVLDAVADSQGNLYLGTGNQGNVYRLNAAGELETYFSSEEVLVRSLVVDDEDVLYVGTAPNGRVYRLRPGENPEVFFDPEADYIWDMQLDDAGHLYVATGSPAMIFKVPAEYRMSEDATVVFETQEEHIPVIALEANGTLLAGTSPSALLYRVLPGDTRGRVLHNANAAEITAIFPAAGTIVFATMTDANGTGNQTPMDLPQLLAQVQTPTPQNGAAQPHGNNGTPAKPAAAEPAKSSPSFIYRLHANGFAEPLWSPGSANIFAMCQRGTASWWVGTDNDGRVYEVDGSSGWGLHQQADKGGDISVILNTAGEAAQTYVITSNPAVVYVLSDAPAALGSFESAVVDAQHTARWGHVRMAGARRAAAGNSIMWSTRAGNVPQPDATWSAWQTAVALQIQSPPARYLQYKVEIDASDVWVDDVRLFYSLYNVAPIVSRINILLVGLDAFVTKVPSKPNLSLNQLLKHATEPVIPVAITPKMKQQFRAKGEQGYVSFVWQAMDPNGDALQFTLELKKKTATQWSVVAEDLQGIAYSMNTRGYDDGYYQLKVIADDGVTHIAGEGKQGQRVSYPFLIDNGSPVIELISEVRDAEKLLVKFIVEDEWSVIEQVEYVLDGQESRSLLPIDIHYDQQREEFELVLRDLEFGTHSLIIKARDELNNHATLPVTLTLEP